VNNSAHLLTKKSADWLKIAILDDFFARYFVEKVLKQIFDREKMDRVRVFVPFRDN